MRVSYPVVEIAIAAGIFLAANGVYGLELMIGRSLPVGQDITGISVENTARRDAAARESLCIASPRQPCLDRGKNVADAEDAESSLLVEASSDTMTLFVLPE